MCPDEFRPPEMSGFDQEAGTGRESFVTVCFVSYCGLKADLHIPASRCLGVCSWAVYSVTVKTWINRKHCMLEGCLGQKR